MLEEKKYRKTIIVFGAVLFLAALAVILNYSSGREGNEISARRPSKPMQTRSDNPQTQQDISQTAKTEANYPATSQLTDNTPVNQGVANIGNDNKRSISDTSSSAPLSSDEIKQLISVVKAEASPFSSSGRQAIYRLDAIRDGPAIMDLLNDSDAAVRESAAITLGLLGIKEAIPGLRKLLYDNEPVVRKTAIEVLGSLGAVRDTPEIISLLNDTDSWTRRAAVIVLGEAGVKEALPEITKLVTDPNEYVRVCVVDALTSLSGREAVPEIIKLLDDKEKYVRGEASTMLIRLDDKSAIPPMMELLQAKPERAYDGVACALAALGTAEAMPIFIKLLSHSDAQVRCGAIAALRHLGAKETFTCYVCYCTNIKPASEQCQLAVKEAFPELIKLISDEDENIQSLAAMATGQLGAKEAIPQLLERLDEKHKYQTQRDTRHSGSLFGRGLINDEGRTSRYAGQERLIYDTDGLNYKDRTTFAQPR